MLRVQVTTDFAFDTQEYGALFRQCEASAFQHPYWLEVMRTHIAKMEEYTPRMLQIRSKETDELKGFVPFLLRKKLGARLLEYANCGFVDYAIPLLSTDFWALAAESPNLQEDIHNALGPYDVLRIKHLPFEQPAVMGLFPHCEMKKADFSCHIAELGEDYESWRREAISKSERKHRDKKRRALIRAGGWEMRKVTEKDAIEAAFKLMRDLHRPRFENRPGKDLLQEDYGYAFYLDVAVKHAADGFAKVYTFFHDGEMVAAHFGVQCDQHYYYLIMAVDYERLGKYSPGLLMLEDVIEDGMKDGLKIMDLSIGDQPYKEKFGTKTGAIYSLLKGDSLLGSVGLSAAKMVDNSKMSKPLRKVFVA